MAFADILLHIQGYPEDTDLEAIDAAVRLAARHGATLTALALAVDVAIQPNWLADRLLGLADLVAEAERRSAASCRQRLEHVRASAAREGARCEVRTVVEDISLQSVRLAQEARAYDFCIHVPPAGGLDKALVEAVIFQSGRPVLILPAGSSTAFERVVVAWDGGAAAARALNEALPILCAARAVELVLVAGDKPGAEQTLAQAVRHLERHGVKAAPRVLADEGRPAALAIQRHIDAHEPDLLVMGAYGHSRLREMVLGGVTDHLLADPRTPVWFSH